MRLRQLRSSPSVGIMGDEDGPPVPPVEPEDEGGLSKLSPALQRLGRRLEATFAVHGDALQEAVLEAEEADDAPGAEEVVDYDSLGESASEREDCLGAEIGASDLKQGDVGEHPGDPEDADAAQPAASSMDDGAAKLPRQGYERGPPLHKFKVRGPSGRHLGDLVWNAGSGSLDAHCRCGHGRCRLNRTLHAWDGGRPLERMSPKQKAQGRPVGLLVAWLFAGPGSEKDAHVDLKTGRGPLADCVSFSKRKSCRELLASDPAWHRFVEAAGFVERPARPDEDNEPVGLP